MKYSTCGFIQSKIFIQLDYKYHKYYLLIFYIKLNIKYSLPCYKTF